MKTCHKLLFCFLTAHISLVLPQQSFAKPMHLFLDPVEEAVCRRPLVIEVLVLNENGEIDKEFEGKKELSITVRETGARNGSFGIRSDKVTFKKGTASFTIENNEEEILNVDVAVVGSELVGQISLDFEDRDISPPEIVAIYEEDPGILKLEFNEELEEESAQKTRNYKAVTNERETYPESIEYHKDYVFLKFEQPFEVDEEGHIELEGIQDVNGNEIASGLRSPDFEGTCPDSCPD